MCLAIPGKLIEITHQLDETFRFRQSLLWGNNERCQSIHGA